MKVFNTFLMCLGMIFFLSCKEKISSKKETKNDFDFWVDLPSSINGDSLVKGIIKYEISESPAKDLKLHKKYTFLYATLLKEKILSLEDLKKVPHDTFAVIEKNLIPIYGMKTAHKGDVSFQGFLVEQFFYSISRDSTRIITKERRVEHTIRVE